MSPLLGMRHHHQPCWPLQEWQVQENETIKRPLFLVHFDILLNVLWRAGVGKGFLRSNNCSYGNDMIPEELGA